MTRDGDRYDGIFKPVVEMVVSKMEHGSNVSPIKEFGNLESRSRLFVKVNK